MPSAAPTAVRMPCQSGSSSVFMTTAPLVTPDVDESNEVDEPWKVVVWNDPVNLFDYVIWVLMNLFGHSKDKASKLTHQIHHEGRAVVSDGPREQAEIDCYRLHRQGLWATLEQ